MSGLTSIINIATSGVLAQQTAIGVTAENIANVTTPDFARRSVNFSADPVTGQFSGVSAQIIREAGNSFLQASAFASAGDANAANLVSDALQRVVDALGTTGDNISFANQASEATAALARLGANPGSVAARREAVNAIDAALASFNRTTNVIDAERARASTGLTDNIDQANIILEQINQLNVQLGNSGGQGSAGDALSAQLSQLSTLLNISVSRDNLGRATILAGGGQLLADPTGVAILSLGDGTPPEISITALSAQPDLNAAAVATITNDITGGQIGGALALVGGVFSAVSEIITSARDQFIGALNDAAAGNTVFPPPQVLAGANVVTDGDITALAGRSTLGVLDPSGRLVSRVDIDFSGNSFSVDGGVPINFQPTVEGLRAALSQALAPTGSAINNNGVLTFDGGAGRGLALANDAAGLGALLGLNSLTAQSPDGPALRASIRANPRLLAAGRIDLSQAGIGDRVTGANDGAGANALFEAGRSQATQIANALGEIGARANAASNEAAIAQSFADSISAQSIADGGVNLEEELSNLILFQRSFNANARVIAAADELYQSVLALI